MDAIRDILPHFRFEGRFDAAKELTSGHINATWLLDYREGGRLYQYTLQRINTYVFRHPDEVMRNITRVTEHLKRGIEREQGDAERRVLTVIRTRDGEALHADARGGFWRAYTYISGALSRKGGGGADGAGRARLRPSSATGFAGSCLPSRFPVAAALRRLLRAVRERGR